MLMNLSIQGLVFIIPSFVIVGLANSTTTLYLGLVLYSLGTLIFAMTGFICWSFTGLSIVLGSAVVIPCITAMTAAYGRADQKGAVMGTLRSLGALARAVGPLASSIGNVFSSLGKLKILNSQRSCDLFILAFFVFGAGPCYCFGACALFLPLLLLRKSEVWALRNWSALAIQKYIKCCVLRMYTTSHMGFWVNLCDTICFYFHRWI